MPPETVKLVKDKLDTVFTHPDEVDPASRVRPGFHKGMTPTNEAEAEAVFGKKPSPTHQWSPLYGWYDPQHGVPRC